ncbi:hypothetical protein NDU88_003584 [Pleurodeles waltl]|uniref:Uncharacterized protein n=1 Tax=Pleurodeles waltl TaxID=8319 RepID=A0AAV7KYX6_PLEWA|nr:hypothetical protein NDU88_003584 [Pleurodeles waltl]
MSIALLQHNVKMNQEVNVRPPKDTCGEKEDAEDQREKNGGTETTGEAVRENKEKTVESLTPMEAEEDDSDRVPLWNSTTCYIPGWIWLKHVRARIRAVGTFWGAPRGTGEETNADKRAGRKYNINLSETQGRYL